MADLSITASAIQYGGTPKQATAGVTLTAGQAIYLDATDSNKAKLAQADGTEAEANAKGITLNGADAGQPVNYAELGELTLNAVAAAGAVYVLSATAGGIAPEADLLSTERLTIIGYGKSTTKIELLMKATGIQHA